VADHINIPEHTMAYLVKVTDHINIPEKNGRTSSSEVSHQYT
jgi:hypothetical protein